MKVLIIGGVAGGATFAARMRRLDETADITMIERGEFVSFANCGLPYHISGTISERERLLLETPQSFKDKMNVNVKTKTNAIKINPDKKTVLLKDLVTEIEYEESYDYLMLSPGAEPIIPNLPGIDSKKIFTLRNIPDMDRIISEIKLKAIKKAVVVGGGFIGLEMAENLKEIGIDVSIVELSSQVLNPVDFDTAAVLHQHITDHGVNLFLNDGVEKFETSENKIKVYLKSGRNIDSEIVILAIGVSPETTLAKTANLELGRAGIKVNKYMQTSNEFIYAAGDAVEIEHYLTNKPVLIPLAGPANRQARIAADNIKNGNKFEFDGILGTSIVKVFDMTAASVGLNEKVLKSQGIEYLVSFTHSNSNAGYYPGAMPLTIKLIFSKNGDIYGAQITGYKGVDKRTDVMATAIKAGLKVWDLENLELAYAPPYGSAKDPVNISGYVANNIIKGDMEIIHWYDLNPNDKNVILLDVRTKEEVQLGSLPNAINIPLNELRNKADALDKSKKIIVFCAIGARGYNAYRILKARGFNVVNLSGGLKTYNAATAKIVNKLSELEEEKIDKNLLHFIVDESEIIKVNACGLQCPGPIMETFKSVSKMQVGQVVEVQATDPGFEKDIRKWAEKTGNRVLELNKSNGIISAKIQKGELLKESFTNAPVKDNKTIIVFDGDLDKVLASFIIANGALAMGKKVTMFFTFWGLNALRKETYSNKNKSFIEKMFAWMMPAGTNKLKLSNMNMMGMGTALMKKVMKEKNVDSLALMMNKAQEAGVKLIACQMSMDIMGIHRDELIDGIEVGGVATYLADAEDSNVNLFI